jgi:hypothetical protein
MAAKDISQNDIIQVSFFPHSLCVQFVFVALLDK